MMKPSKIASAWTKHRLRTHKELIIEEIWNPVCWNGRDCFLVKSTDGWSGWIPCDEVEIIECQ